MRDLQVTLTLGSLTRLYDIQFVPHKACFVCKALFSLLGVAFFCCVASKSIAKRNHSRIKAEVFQLLTRTPHNYICLLANCR